MLGSCGSGVCESMSMRASWLCRCWLTWLEGWLLKRLLPLNELSPKPCCEYTEYGLVTEDGLGREPNELE